MPVRWWQHYRLFRFVVVTALLAVPVLTVTNGWLYSQNADQRARLAVVRQKQADDERVIQAQQRFIQAQETAKKLAAKTLAREAETAKRNAAARCAAAIDATRNANNIITGVQVTLIQVAKVSINPRAAVALRRRAHTFHLFPKPDCDPVYHASKTKGAGG